MPTCVGCSRRVLAYSVLIQGAGGVLLFYRFLFDYPWLEALWHAVFHSISAFCNAGFGLLDDNLIPYQGDLLVNGTIISLIVLGGMGFPVMLDLLRNWRGGNGGSIGSICCCIRRS